MPGIVSQKSEVAFSNYTDQFIIRNDSGNPIKNAALAWLDYDNEWRESWSDPIVFQKNIANGKSAAIKFQQKVRVVSFKLKWYSDGRRYVIERIRAPDLEWAYFTLVELTIDQALGPFFSRLHWERIKF